MSMKKAQHHKSRQTRLIIAIPALFLLFTIGVGISNYQIVQLLFEQSGNPAIEKVMADISRYILISSLIITGFALLIGVGISIAILKPLKHMVKSASMLMTGSLPRKVDISMTDEMHELGSSFNQLVEYLQTLFEERDRYILEGESGSIILVDEHRRIKALNRAAEVLLGVTSEGVVGETFSHMASSTEPYLVDALHRIVQNRTLSEILRWVSPTGKRRAYIASCSYLQDTNRGLKDLVISLRDISELENFYEELQRADTLAAIGALATGVSHEIRNPLASIKSLVQLVDRRIDDRQKVREYLSIINKEITRIDNVVGAIMQMSEPKGDPYERCDINQLLAEALIRLRQSKFAAKIRSLSIIEDYSMLPFVLLPHESMIRAFYNILENAAEATTHDGSIRIITSVVQGSGGTDDSIEIKISNTGSRISAADREKIFQIGRAHV